MSSKEESTIDAGPTSVTRSQQDPGSPAAWSGHLSSQQNQSSAYDCFAMADQKRIITSLISMAAVVQKLLGSKSFRDLFRRILYRLRTAKPRVAVCGG